MQTNLPKRIFVTGTGTDVGKTVISSILVSGLAAKYWKPIQCGLEEPTDSQWIQKTSELDRSHFIAETYRLPLPLSPHAAAAAENISIKLDDFLLPEISYEEYLIIEGAGGIMVPINEDQMILDLMVKLKIPVLLVSSNVLGTINHTLLSLEQLKRSGVDVLGVILNGDINTINRKAIEKYGDTTVLAEIPMIEQINSTILKELFLKHF